MSEKNVKPIPAAAFIPSIALASALVVAYVSRDFCCFPVGSAVLSTFILGLSVKLWNVEQLRRWKHVRKLQCGTFAALVVFFAVTFHTDKNDLFREAFGSSMPAGVQHFAIDRYVHGLPGDRWALMRFEADAATVETLCSQGGFEKDRTFELVFSENQDRKHLISLAFSNFWESGGAKWTEIPMMRDPFFRRRTWIDRTARPQTSLLWDSATRRAYALYIWD